MRLQVRFNQRSSYKTSIQSRETIHQGQHRALVSLQVRSNQRSSFLQNMHPIKRNRTPGTAQGPRAPAGKIQSEKSFLTKHASNQEKPYTRDSSGPSCACRYDPIREVITKRASNQEKPYTGDSMGPSCACKREPTREVLTKQASNQEKPYTRNSTGPSLDNVGKYMNSVHAGPID